MSSQNNTKYIYFGGGCFWCIEACFQDLNGINNVMNGYSGGNQKTANYKDVSSGKTQHAEICKINYNPDKITFETLLEVFFLIHDPTTKNKQGNDIGPQYRSIIFYNNETEKNNIEVYVKKLEKNKIYTNIVTEIVPFKSFYKAESDHQNYFKSNPNAPYCSFIINSKIKKLRKKLKKYYL